MSEPTREQLGPPSIRLAFLEIWIHGRRFPEAQDRWDRNWLDVVVHCPKTQRLKSEYRRLFPSGALLRRYQRLQATLIASATVIAWTLGFPGPAIVLFAVVGCALVWLSLR
jgi:hypothetical protein